MATYSVNWSAILSSTSGSVVVGHCLCMGRDAVRNVEGTHYVATAANRALYGRTVGIATTEGDATNPVVVMIETGIVMPAVTGLAVGAVSWVRVSSAGALERCTPGVGDDIVGVSHADGSVQFAPGIWDWTNYAGGGVTTPTGTGIPHVVAGVQDAATSLIVNADVAAAAAIAVSKLAAGTNTYVLTTTGGVPVWAAPAASSSAPTGTGYYHVTAGVMDAASVSLTWTGDTTGTGTGSSFALTTVKVNGATVPAAGALTTGNAPYVSGASALTYSALNLAGGAGWVTGVLPSANVASHSGDVTGAHSATVVAKVNGATVPAAGALTTGNGPYVSGVSALTYSALNLAGGAGYVSGALPLANQAAPTGSAFAKVTAGAWDAASSKVDTTNSAHVTVPATANGVVTSSGTVLQQASGVTAGGTWIGLTTGASLATTGLIRLGYVATDIILQAPNSGATDTPILQRNAADRFRFGDAGSWAIDLYGTNVSIYGSTATYMYAPGGSVVAIQLASAATLTGKPIIGNSAEISPWSCHGGIAFSTTANADYTVTAAQYAYDWLEVTTSTWSVSRTMILPAPATKAAGYYKYVFPTTGGHDITVSTTTGTTVLVPYPYTQRLWIDDTGVRKADVAILP